MIITVKSNADKDQLNEFQSWLTNQGYTLHPSQGANYTLIGVIGDTSALDARLIESLEIVDKVTRIQEPFKKANRKFHPKILLWISVA